MALNTFKISNNVYPVSGGVYPASLVTATWVDQYDDQDMAEYTAINGAVSDWTYDTSTPIQGTATLRQNTAVARTRAHSQEGDGLDNYVAKGTVFQCKVRFGYDAGGATIQSGILFGVQDGNNFYEIRAENGDNDFQLNVTDAGSTSALATDTNSPLSHAAGDAKVYTIEVTWDDGTLGGSDNDITCELLNADKSTTYSTISANDSTHATQTGVGASTYDNDGTGYVDLDAYEIIG